MKISDYVNHNIAENGDKSSFETILSIMASDNCDIVI